MTKTMLNNQTEKGVYAPSYYNAFRCIADQCHHSCCIDWEICIDEATYAKYQQMGEILDTVKECEDGPCFALREDGKCPHLNDRGLCNIILSHGEAYLCEICQNHPRFYHSIHSGRIEAGLGIVCEEACRLILENEKRFSLVKIEDWDEDFDDNDSDDTDNPFDPLPQREQIISCIESDGDFDEKIDALKAEFAIPELYTPDEWLDRFLSLEILEADWKQDLQSMRGRFLQTTAKHTNPYGKYYRRLLTYFVYRHISTADSAIHLRARLAFCILSVQVIRSLFEENGVGASPSDEENAPAMLIDWARRYSAEIEYSQDNTDELIFALESGLIG